MCAVEKASQRLQGCQRLQQARPARQNVRESGPVKAGRITCNDSGVRVHRSVDGTLHEPSELPAQTYQRAKLHSKRGRDRRQGETSQGQPKPPDPSRERRYPFALTRMTERPVHPSLSRAFSSSPCTVLDFACRWLPKKSVPS